MSEHCKKLRRIANNPAAVIANNIAQLTKKVDKTKDWQEIIQQNIISFLANPLTGQTGTADERKSLLLFVEESSKVRGSKCLSVAKDNVGREYTLKMHFKKRKESVIFSFQCWSPYINEDGTCMSSGQCHEFEIVETSNCYYRSPSFRIINGRHLWDDHFRASREFNSMINRNCLCEYRKKILSGKYQGKYLHNCHNKKAVHSKFCFGHMHKGCVDNP